MVLLSIISAVMLILSAISFILSIVILYNDNVYMKKHSYGNNNTTNTKHNAYIEAQNTIMQLLELSLFDMYIKCEILDFETQFTEISDRMMTISGDTDYMNDVIEQFNKQYSEEDTNNDNFDNY